MTIQTVAVIGAGIMGEGIAASIFRRGTYQVYLYDVNQAMVGQAVENIKKGARKNMPLENIIPASSIEMAVGKADLIIEAIIENPKIKHDLFKELDRIAPAHAILASNTSSLPITDMANVTKRPDKVIGLHFFNPAIIMRLVEIISCKTTSEETLSAASAFIADIKKTGVVVKESPGFVVNRILIPLVNEAFYLLEEHKKKFNNDVITTALDIDASIEMANILLMGPFNLVDLVGVDTAYRVSEIIYEGLGKSDKYLPCNTLKEYFQNGFFGRKSGRGVFHYANHQIDPDANPSLTPAGTACQKPTQPTFRWDFLTAAMVNEAFRIVHEKVVDNWQDVDVCMELGTRWPKGPFALAKHIGLEKVVAVLKERQALTNGHARYEICPLLLKPDDRLKTLFE